MKVSIIFSTILKDHKHRYCNCLSKFNSNLSYPAQPTLHRIQDSRFPLLSPISSAGRISVTQTLHNELNYYIQMKKELDSVPPDWRPHVHISTNPHSTEMENQLAPATAMPDSTLPVPTEMKDQFAPATLPASTIHVSSELGHRLAHTVETRHAVLQKVVDVSSSSLPMGRRGLRKGRFASIVKDSSLVTPIC